MSQQACYMKINPTEEREGASMIYLAFLHLVQSLLRNAKSTCSTPFVPQCFKKVTHETLDRNDDDLTSHNAAPKINVAHFASEQSGIGAGAPVLALMVFHTEVAFLATSVLRSGLLVRVSEMRSLGKR